MTKIDEEEAKLLDVEVGTSAFFQSGLIFGEDSRPVEYFKSVVLPKHLTFATEMKSSEASQEPKPCLQ